MTIGRPTIYTQELVDTICAELAEGRSLRSVLLDDGMPSMATVFRWLREEDKKTFQEQYARAKEESADALAEEMLDIADDGTNDWMERQGENAEGWQVNGEHIQRSRVRIDTRKWIASKLKPKKYGDRVALAGVEDAPLAVTIIDLTGKK